MKNQKLIIAAVAAVIITGILAGGITYVMLSARFSKENDSLAKRLDVLEKAQNKKPSAQEVAPSVVQKAEDAEAAKYGDWLTFTNAGVGFTLRYPTDWTYEVFTGDMDGKSVNTVTFLSPGTKYYLTFGLRTKGADILISRRTGVGAGDLKQNGTVTIAGKSVKKTELIYKNKTKAIFYPGAGSVFETQGFEGAAEFSIIDSAAYEAFNLAGAAEGISADKIVSSLKIIK